MSIEPVVREPVETPGGYRWVVLAVGTLGVFAALGLARFGYSTVLEPMQQELRFGNTAAGALASANLTGYLLLAVIGGALASRFGTRLVAVAGLAVVGVSMLLTSTAGSFAAICCWRAVTGVGSGAANVAIMGMWPAWFPARLRGRAAGVAVAGSSLAMMLTGVTVPGILQAAPAGGWRTCWLLFGLAALAVTALTWIFLRNRPAGAAPFAAAAPRWGSVYRSPAVWHLGAIYTAFGFSYIIYLTFFVKYLVAERDYSKPDALWLFFLMGACSVFCGVIWGAVSDYFGRRTALTLVFLVHAAAFALFALSPTPGGLLASAVLFGFSAWSVPAIMAAACGDVLGARLSAAGLGFITLFFGIGQAAAPSVAGALADSTGSFGIAFLLAAVIALAGAGGSLLLPKGLSPTERESRHHPDQRMY